MELVGLLRREGVGEKTAPVYCGLSEYSPDPGSHDNIGSGKEKQDS
jgi:hypothetical protein